MTRTIVIAVAFASSAVLAQGLAPGIGAPLPGLTPQELALFNAGQATFQHAFTVAEGLGPTYNQPACSTCHASPAIGGSDPGTSNNVTHFMINNQGSFLPAIEQGGPVIQRLTIASLPEGAGCSLPADTLPPMPGIGTSQRHTPPVFGFGLLDAVSDQELLAWQGRKPWKDPAVVGIANWGTELESLTRLTAFTFDPTRTQPAGAARVGRFGWKSQTSTLFQFSVDPFNIELGVTTPFFPRENTPNGGPVPPGCQLATSARPNDANGAKGVTLMHFQALLAPPEPLPPTAETAAGALLFAANGCGDCHRPRLRTVKDYYLPLADGTVTRVAALSNKTFAPYSDLLLHEMGPGLEDGRVMGRAGTRFWRTTPLWGARFKSRFLHDGSAASVHDAIEAHGGESAGSRARYDALPIAQQRAVSAFVNSL